MEAPAASAGGGAAGGMPAPDITVSKGSAKRSFPFQGDETLEFIPLGAGNEVGRSCCILKVRCNCASGPCTLLCCDWATLAITAETPMQSAL